MANRLKSAVVKRLAVKREPGLVIYSDGQRAIDQDEYWPRHREAIVKSGIELLIEQRSDDIILRLVQAFPGRRPIRGLPVSKWLAARSPNRTVPETAVFPPFVLSECLGQLKLLP